MAELKKSPDTNDTTNNNKDELMQTEEAKKILRRDNEEYKIVKKLPKRFPSSQNDIYITMKTDFKAQYEKCKYLLSILRNQTEPNEIVIHAMGSAINRYICLFFLVIIILLKFLYF
jgi:hypothetical protein